MSIVIGKLVIIVNDIILIIEFSKKCYNEKLINDACVDKQYNQEIHENLYCVTWTLLVIILFVNVLEGRETHISNVLCSIKSIVEIESEHATLCL